MKRVLIVTVVSGFLPQFERNDVKILQEMGCEVHYASNFNCPIYDFDRMELEKQGIRLHPIDVEKSPAKIRENTQAVRQLKELMNREKIDIIHCHNPMGGVAARAAAAGCAKKPYMIYTAHGLHFYKGAPKKNWLLFYPVERLFARRTDQLITINAEDYRRVQGFPLKKGGSVSLIHGVGVDDVRFAPQRETAIEKRRELGIPPEAFHIVTAAELNDNKNLSVVIEAVAGLAAQDIYYSICGRGPMKEDLQELIREKGLTGRVRLLGFRTDMEEILQTADCFAFPSKREGLGVAAVEALLCGVPLIAADNRGTREYAVDGQNGIVCRADHAEDFQEAIDRLYTDRVYRERLASGCRASAEKFTIREVEKTMRRVYEKALAEC